MSHLSDENEVAESGAVEASSDRLDREPHPRGKSEYESPESERTSNRTDERSLGISRNAFLLLIATLCTTFYAGLLQSASYGRYQFIAGFAGFDLTQALPAWHQFGAIVGEALAFSGSLLGILFAHEMGHYLTARRAGVRVSFPTFLPSVPPFGTLGAFIRMETHEMPANSLMRVAAWGPFAGMFVAIPVLVVGLLLSDIRPLPVVDAEVTRLGSCLLIAGMEKFLVGEPTAGTDIFLHPVAFAGWAGCFVTSLNLLPVGQLDGGHVTYALIGERRARVVAGCGLVALVAGSWMYIGWGFFALVIALVLGWQHPPMVRKGVASGSPRLLGWAAVALFALTFTPIPIHGGGFRDVIPEWIAAIRFFL